ncbi:MAG: hypothetical protein RRA92_10865, partial [Gemmatimonadota bacterium]|nr:hypothetical protein [Gemmatimonadota bacterium]
MRGHALLLCACLPLAGCAVFATSGGGPGGLSRFDADLRSLATRGEFERALELTEGKSAPGDDLLRTLQRAAVLRHAGRYDDSNRLLQEAELEIEDRYTKSLSKAALSLITNDRVLAWRPSRVERMLLHCYGALNYLALGDPDEAAVEARRLSGLLEAEEVEAFTDGVEPAGAERELRRAMRAIAALVFEAAGEWNDASVAWRNAGPAFAGLGAGIPGAGGAAGFGTADLAGPAPTGTARPFDARPPPPDSGEIVVVAESGFLPHRVERSAVVPIYRRDVHDLDDHDASDRRDAALCVAWRALGRQPDGPPAGLFDGFGARDLRRCGRRGGGSLYVLALAWPDLRETPDPVRGGTVRVGPDAAAPLRPVADISAAYADEHRSGLAGVLVKAVIRAAAKHAIVEEIREEAEEEDETLGDVVGLLGNAVAVASEHADTRSWNLLPGALHVARIRVPAGRH